MKERIKKFLSLFQKKSGPGLEHGGPNPDRDWHIILGVFFILLICTAFANYVYYTNHSDTKTNSEPPSGPKLKTGQIEEVAKYIRDKQTRYEYILNSPLPTLNPD